MNLDAIPLILIASALLLLIILSIIDLKTRLLPNIFVFPFAALGPVFHFTTNFDILSFQNILIGGLCGYAFLYLLRAAASAYYKQDALGLGDVKLMGAAGLWLGFEGVFLALTLGAFAGLVHGIIHGFLIAVQNKTKPNFHRLTIPAGPGFAVGIILTGIWILYQSGYITYPL